MGIIIGILNSVIVVLSLFFICIILIQRGKGGGLAGAFGGVGGSSAFGTKTGDVFTRITIGVAIAWIILAMLLVVITNRSTESAWGNDSSSSASKELPSSSTSKGKSTSTRTKAGEVPPPAPTPAHGSAQPLPPVELPAIPEQPLSSSQPAPSPK